MWVVPVRVQANPLLALMPPERAAHHCGGASWGSVAPARGGWVAPRSLTQLSSLFWKDILCFGFISLLWFLWWWNHKDFVSQSNAKPGCGKEGLSDNWWAARGGGASCPALQGCAMMLWKLWRASAAAMSQKRVPQGRTIPSSQRIPGQGSCSGWYKGRYGQMYFHCWILVVPCSLVGLLKQRLCSVSLRRTEKANSTFTPETWIPAIMEKHFYPTPYAPLGHQGSRSSGLQHRKGQQGRSSSGCKSALSLPGRTMPARFTPAEDLIGIWLWLQN